MTAAAAGLHALFALAVFGLAAVLAWGAMRLRIMDVPNTRSSHERPVPKGGGGAIVLAFFVGLAVFYGLGGEAHIAPGPMAGFCVAALLVAAIGLLDDIRGYGVRVKLAGQLAGAAVLLASGIVLSSISLPFAGRIELGWLGYPLTALWVVGLANAVNFMDGLNGLAGGVAAIAAGFFAAVTFADGSHFVYVLSYVLAASSLGFLVFNFPRARLFMGDVGSQFLGFVLAALAVVAAELDSARTSFMVMPLLVSVILFDTVFTVIRRLAAGERITEAHRSHLYQFANRLGMSHVGVSLYHYGFTALAGIGALVMVGLAPDDKAWTFLPFLAALAVYAVLVTGAARSRGLTR